MAKSSVAPPNTQQPQPPTYFGLLTTPLDAILLLAACDIPWSSSTSQSQQQPTSSTPLAPTSNPTIRPPRRIERRLLDSEKTELIKSGNVFVFAEDETQMRRWTDGKVWSASRVNGSFLTYRELEFKKR